MRQCPFVRGNTWDLPAVNSGAAEKPSQAYPRIETAVHPYMLSRAAGITRR